MYRVFPARDNGQKFVLKLFHAACMMVVLIITVVGLKAAFDSHNLSTDQLGRPAPPQYGSTSASKS